MCREPIKQAVLSIRSASPEQQEYYKITFTDCRVLYHCVDGTGRSNGVPPSATASAIAEMEKFSLGFKKIEHHVHELNPEGKLGAAVKCGFDLEANKAI